MLNFNKYSNFKIPSCRIAVCFYIKLDILIFVWLFGEKKYSVSKLWLPCKKHTILKIIKKIVGNIVIFKVLWKL